MNTILFGLFAIGLVSSQAMAAVPPAVPVKHEATFTGSFIHAKDATKSPVLKGKPAAPVYPQKMRGHGIRGAAQVVFLVDVTGRTEQVQCVEAHDASFAEAAVKAVKKWRYKPGEKDGQKVPVLMVQMISFNLIE